MRRASTAICLVALAIAVGSPSIKAAEGQAALVRPTSASQAAKAEDCKVPYIHLMDVWNKPLRGVLVDGDSFKKDFVKRLARKDFPLSYEIVYRPAPPSMDGRVLETNPHFKEGVRVCPFHRVVVYVGLHPYRAMPQVQGETLQGATDILLKCTDVPREKNCKAIKFDTRCAAGTEGSHGPGARVRSQWPAAEKERIGVAVKGKRIQEFPDVTQMALLEIDCDQPRIGSGPSGTNPDVVSKKGPEVQDVVVKKDPPPDPVDGKVAAGAAAGTAAGALGGYWLASYLRRRSLAPPPAPEEAGARVVVRSRPDIP